MESIDLLIAEISNPSTGVGIELGRAQILKIPIICIHKPNTKISESLKNLTKTFISYRSKEELLEKLSKLLK